MKKLQHANVVRLFEVIDDDVGQRLFLVMEYVSLGQVMQWDSSRRRYAAPTGPAAAAGGASSGGGGGGGGGALSEATALRHFRDITCGCVPMKTAALIRCALQHSICET